MTLVGGMAITASFYDGGYDWKRFESILGQVIVEKAAEAGAGQARRQQHAAMPE